ncbi:ATP-dependent RNA helicase [Dirofilaria immitis]
MFAFFQYTEFVQQICRLCQKMHERSHVINKCLAYGCFSELDIGELLGEELVFNCPCKLADLAGIGNVFETKQVAFSIQLTVKQNLQ